MTMALPEDRAEDTQDATGEGSDASTDLPADTPGGDTPGVDTPGEDTPDPEFARWLFAQECGFIAGVATMEQLPEFALSEVAFAGRSNVGKSSLMNALTGRNHLARTSHTPGRTRQINFFDLGGKMILVDLPGYGYAKAPKSEIARWTEVTRDYLRGRPTLRRVCVLIDSRRGVQSVDREVMTALDRAAVSYQLVLTKSDKASGAEVERRLAEIDALRKTHIAMHPVVPATSAHGGKGIAELRTQLGALVPDSMNR